MEKDFKLEIIKVLKDAYESGNFEHFIPYLADDVVRTSMWELNDIEGKENFINYLHEKEEQFSKNDHYFTRLVQLKYIQGKPSTEAIGNAFASNGSTAGGMDIENAQLVLWYPDGEYCLTIDQSPFFNDPVLVQLDFNAKKQVSALNLCNSNLFHYEQIFEPEYKSVEELHTLAINEVKYRYEEFNNDVEVLTYEQNLMPHLDVYNGSKQRFVIVFSDHYPFSGKYTDAFIDEVCTFEDATKVEYEIILVQIKGYGEKPYHIKVDDNFSIEIVKRVIANAHLLYC